MLVELVTAGFEEVKPDFGGLAFQAVRGFFFFLLIIVYQ